MCKVAAITNEGILVSESKQFWGQKGRVQLNFHSKYPIGAPFYGKLDTLSIAYYCLVPIICISSNVSHIGNLFSTFVALRAISLLNPIDLIPNFACPQNLIRSLVMDENWGIHTSGVSQYVCKVSTITYGRNNSF